MEYNSTNNFWKKLLSLVLHTAVSVVLGIVLLMPFGYIAKDMNHNGDKAFLENGYEYTLNGVIGDEFADWVVHAEYEKVEEEPKEEEQEPGVVIPEDNDGETTTPEVEEGGDNIQE